MCINLESLTGVASSIAACIAAVASWKAVKISKETVEEQFRPQIVVFYRNRDSVYRARNVGKGTAMNIKISVLKLRGSKIRADLGEAICLPPEDEQTIHFYFDKAKKQTILSESPTGSAIHSIFNPEQNSGHKYKFKIEYEDVGSKAKYITDFETESNTTKHLKTRKMVK